MKHLSGPQHLRTEPGAEDPSAMEHPGERSLHQEVENDRRGERGLILKSLIAAAFVAVLVIIRTLYFT